MIMLPLAPFGIWFGQKNGKKLYSLISNIFTWSSVISCAMGILSWANIPKYNNAQIDKHATFFRIFALIMWGVLILAIVLLITLKIRNHSNKAHKNKQSEENSQTLSDKTNKSNIHIANSTMSPKEEVINTHQAKSSSPISQSPQNAKEFLHEDIKTSALENTPAYLIAHLICPECHGELKERRNWKTGKRFMGCQNYFTDTHCKYTIDYIAFKAIETKIKNCDSD